MDNLPSLPLGIQSLEVLRNRRCVYVDRTERIHRMIADSPFNFLSRPRRFGKSLLVSTLKCLFEGRSELFEDTWIGKPGRWNWEKHPVVTFDFNEISHSTPEELKQSLLRRLNQIAKSYGIEMQATLLADDFRDLIMLLHEKTGKPVAILVDEYDKPIITHLGKGEAALELAKSNRDVLRQLFGTLKGVEVSSRLHFVFLTGISKFSKVSVFLELNNLTDLTMADRYSDLCGYTETELEIYFTSHMKQFEKQLDCSSEELREQLAFHYIRLSVFGKRNFGLQSLFNHPGTEFVQIQTILV